MISETRLGELGKNLTIHDDINATVFLNTLTPQLTVAELRYLIACARFVQAVGVDWDEVVVGLQMLGYDERRLLSGSSQYTASADALTAALKALREREG